MSSGDGTDLVAAVVAALVQAAAGAAGAAGTAFGAEGVGWVQEGLRQLPRWARAAERAGEAARDDGARQGLAEAVGELLSLHPGLAESLEALHAERAARPAELPEVPPAPPPVTVGDGAFVGGPGQTAVGVGNTLVGGDVHHNTVNKRGTGGLVIAVLVVVAALIALGIHFIGGGMSIGSAPRLPASVEGEQLRASAESDWERTKAALARDGLENPLVAAYGSVPNHTSSVVLAGDDHEARWRVTIAGSTMTFQRAFAETQSKAAKSDTQRPGKQVPTSLPGAMYCSDPTSVSSDEDLACLWFDDKYVVIVSGFGQDPKLCASVIERIHRGTEH